MVPKKNLVWLVVHLWCLGFVLLPLETVLTIDVAQFSLRTAYFVLAGAGVLSLTLFLMESTPAWLVHELFRPPWLLGLIFVLFCFVSVTYAQLPIKAFFYSAWALFGFLFIGYQAKNIFSLVPAAPQIFLRYLSASIVLHSLVVLIDFIAFFYGHLDGLIGGNQGGIYYYHMSRPYGFSFEPSYLGAFFVPSFALILYLLPREDAPNWRKLHFAALGFVPLALAMMFPRAAILSLVFFCTASLFVYVRRHGLTKRQVLIASAAILLALGVVAAVVPKKHLARIQERMLFAISQTNPSLVDGSLLGRLNGIKIAQEMLVDTNYLGAGMGSSYAYWFKYLHPFNATSKDRFEQVSVNDVEYGHQRIQNIWLEVLSETGIIGFTLLAMFVLAVLWTLFRASFFLASPGHCYLLFFSALVYFTFTIQWVPNVCRPEFWAFTGIWLSFGQLERSRRGTASL